MNVTKKMVFPTMVRRVGRVAKLPTISAFSFTSSVNGVHFRVAIVTLIVRLNGRLTVNVPRQSLLQFRVAASQSHSS